MYEIRNEADAAEVIIYDRIGKVKDFWTGDEYGVSAEDFMNSLKELSPKPLNIHIDSGGGDVFEGFAMCAAIQRYEGKTTAYVDGLAASAASYIAVVCDEVKMNDYAYIMIHCASSYCCGNAQKLEDLAARLRSTDDNLAAIYEKRSALTRQEIVDYMNEEKWFTAAEAEECGMCTEVIKTEERIAACIEDDLAQRYHNLPAGVGVRAAHEKPQSHAKRSMESQEQATRPSFLVLNGIIYRKDTQNEH